MAKYKNRENVHAQFNILYTTVQNELLFILFIEEEKKNKTFIKQGLIKLIKSVSNDFIVIQISYFK